MTALRLSLRQWAADGRLYAILAAAGFSLKAIFVKLGYAAGSVDALTLLAMRMGIALPFFAWLIWLSRDARQIQIPLGRMDVMRIVLLGVLGYYLSSLFDFYGLEYISAGLERLILYLYPTLVLVFQAVATRRRPSARLMQAMIISYLGLAIAFVHDITFTVHGSHIITGAAWVFASAITYALYYLGTGAMVKRIGSMRLAGMAGGASSLLVLAHYLVSSEPAKLFDLPSDVWVYAALMAVLSTVLPIYWLSLAVHRMGAAQSAAIGSLGPVLTVFASWVLLNEPLSIFQLAGLALVIYGISRLKHGPAKPEGSSSTKK